MSTIEMDESEHDAKDPPKWWELLDCTGAFLRYHYEEIQSSDCDELKRAAEIILGGHKPGISIKGESA